MPKCETCQVTHPKRSVWKNIQWCTDCHLAAAITKGKCFYCRGDDVEFKSAKLAGLFFVEQFPTLNFSQDREAFDCPQSALSQIRNDCFIGASKSGVLLNCNRFLSTLNWLRYKRGERPLPPPSDFGKDLMAQGQAQEPLIQNWLWSGLYTAYAQAGDLAAAQRDLALFHTGPMVKTLPPELNYNVTPDGVLVMRHDYYYYLIPIEIKYHATKHTIPEHLPADYVCQTQLQMHTLMSDILLYICKVEDDGCPLYEWRLYRRDQELCDRLESRMREYYTEYIELKAELPNRFSNETFSVEYSGKEALLAKGSNFQGLLAALLRYIPEQALPIGAVDTTSK